MSDNNKHENETEVLNEEARKTELSMEELEQVNGGLIIQGTTQTEFFFAIDNCNIN